MGENICKQCYQLGFNFQNIQIAPNSTVKKKKSQRTKIDISQNKKYRHIIRCSTLLIIGEIQIKATMRCHITLLRISSVQLLSLSDSLQPHRLQYARLPCPSPTPRACSNSCPYSQWCHPTISFFVIPFSCLQSFPASGSFPMSQLFTWSGQSIGVSALVSVLPMTIQDWSPLGWTSWISLQSKGLSRVFSNTTVQKHQFFSAQLSLWSNSHIHTWLLEKCHMTLTIRTFVDKVIFLLFNMLSRFVIAFLPRSKHLLISWLQSLSTVIFEPKKIKSVTVSTFFPIYLPWSDGTRCHDLHFLNIEF